MISPSISAKAMVVYHHRNTSRIDITSHDIVETDQDDHFALGAGRAFSIEDKEALVDLLMNVTSEVEFLAPNILVKSRQMLVWYNPQQIIDVLFKGESYKAPMPGLIYMVDGAGRMRCYAYKGKGRPQPSTLLYRAPLGNVYSDGGFCTGNVKTPKHNGVASIEGWENFVLRCTNTHLGTGQVIRGVDDFGSMMQFYKDLQDTNAKSFPSKALVPAIRSNAYERVQLTLKDVLAGAM